MNNVAIVGVGARTPVGLDARQTGFLLRAGFPAMAEAPLADAEGEAITMGFVPTLDGRMVGSERLAALARGPFEEAIGGAVGRAIGAVQGLEVEVHVAIDEGCEEGETTTGMLEAMVKRAVQSASVRVEARGEAGPVAFLPGAVHALGTRRADVVVIGGVHSDFDPRAIAALEASGRLFSRENLDARIPGEAAAFFVLMRTAEVARHGLVPLARVLGVGSGREEARPDNEAPACEALGMTAAVRQATEGLAREGRTAGWMLTDLTFEMRRMNEWQSVFVRAQKVLGRPDFIDSPAQRIGYLGAAAIPLFVVMVATGWRYGSAPAPLVLAMAGNDGGERGALVLGR